MCRALVMLVIGVAVIFGICVMALPREHIARLIMFRDFFDAALPVVGFGALVKYLCCCSSKCKCKCTQCECTSCCNNQRI